VNGGKFVNLQMIICRQFLKRQSQTAVIDVFGAKYFQRFAHFQRIFKRRLGEIVSEEVLI
jgi:hypothetical protein